MKEKLPKSETGWKKILSPEEYHVLREKGTERAFSGKYHDNKKPGKYVCAACGNELFLSDTKFDSGTGWPSFHSPSDNSKVKMHDDSSFGMHRTEVACSKCGGHLGHVFDDGPMPTKKRFCINSCALKFKEKEKK